jgi:hypothetical protein
VAHATDGRETAIVELPRETVERLRQALRRGLNADLHLEELEVRIAQAYLFAKTGRDFEMKRLRRAIRFMWTGLDDEEERKGKRRSGVLKLPLAMDFTRMTALQGEYEFPFRSAANRAASRPPLTLVCPLHPDDAVDKLRELYAFPSRGACLRQLQRVRRYLREVCASSTQPILRHVATTILSNLPADWPADLGD